MPNIFVWPLCFPFAPTDRANARRPASGAPLVGLLSLSFCLLAFPGGQALADDQLQSPGYGGFSYAARNRSQPASAPSDLIGTASSGVPWYADQAQRRQAAAAAPEAARPAYAAPSYAPQNRSRRAGASAPEAARPAYGASAYTSRQVEADRNRPTVKPAVAGEAPAAPERPHLATARAEDFGWKVPAAWSVRETGRDGSAYAAPSRYARIGAGSFVQRGVASWYGGRFHGRPTASGERYDQNEMTAAHKTLPFGALVEVTNQNNGRNVVVRINDRGPFYKGRVIDLSRGAAQMLDIDGIAPVTIKVVSRQVEGPAALN